MFFVEITGQRYANISGPGIPIYGDNPALQGFSGYFSRCAAFLGEKLGIKIFISLRHTSKLFTYYEKFSRKINAEYEVFVSNANAQVEKGNKAAGTRARKAALELSKAMKEFRKVSVEGFRNKFITF